MIWRPPRRRHRRRLRPLPVQYLQRRKPPGPLSGPPKIDCSWLTPFLPGFWRLSRSARCRRHSAFHTPGAVVYTWRGVGSLRSRPCRCGGRRLRLCRSPAGPARSCRSGRRSAACNGMCLMPGSGYRSCCSGRGRGTATPGAACCGAGTSCHIRQNTFAARGGMGDGGGGMPSCHTDER